MSGGLPELAAFIEGSIGARERVVALVGGGGKTSAMFALGRLFAGRGLRVLVTTTTRIFDPEFVSEREGRGFGKVIALKNSASPRSLRLLGRSGAPLVLGAARDGDKLRGVDPGAIGAIAKLFDIVIVEADGSKCLPIKAPSSHEPAMPASSGIVIGVVGLDALGKPMDERVAHRPELLEPLVGCAPGERITAVHVARLAASPDGLFKNAPAKARRVVLLNKADLVAPDVAAACRDAIIAEGCADAVMIGAML